MQFAFAFGFINLILLELSSNKGQKSDFLFYILAIALGKICDKNLFIPLWIATKDQLADLGRKILGLNNT